MEQLIAHLVGDYVLQNHWMAIRKTTAWTPAVVHVLCYGLPFLLLVTYWWQWAVIVSTHLLIDRYRLAALWVDFYGTGKAGWLPSRVESLWREPGVPSRLPDDAPPWLGVWLMILVDQTMHLTINFLVLQAG